MVKKNKDKFNVNPINIKSHLDASFDIDNIKVSEELIAKTLIAVKASENVKAETTDMVQEDIIDSVGNGNQKEDSNKVDKVINIESRRGRTRLLPMKLATVAAALIFVVGIYALNNVGMKEDSSSNRRIMNEKSSGSMDSNSVVYDTVESENARVDDSQVTENKIEEYGITSEGDVNYKLNTVGEPEVGIMEDANTAMLTAETSTISNLYPTQNKTISEFIIKDTNNELISSTKQIVKVNEVYEILDEYPLKRGENSALDYIYQFDILTDDGQSTTILIGSGIYVKTSDELEYTYYEINNSDELLVKLEDFISTMP